MNWRYLHALILIVTLSAPVLATELGVIYYHETMMTANGENYIARTPAGVAEDMQNIKEISSHVKLFVNPYVDANTAWTEQVNTIAKQNGMHTVVTVMVDDRKLTAENWGEYRTKVLALCGRFEGKADEFHVGNEIILHSTGLSGEQIRDRVIELMGACRAQFSGPVSYQELWWQNQVWVGNPEKIYFMTYENFDTFQGIIAEIKANHPNAAIGEWGEDLQEDSAQMDEAWQKDQIERRWDLIQQSGVPIAYLFTYREPNWNGFGILRPETEMRRPLWEVFGADLKWEQNSTSPPPVNTTNPPVNTTPPLNSTPVVNTTKPPTNTTPVVNNTVPTNNTVNTTETPSDNTASSGGSSRRRSGGGGSTVLRSRAELREQEEFDRQAAYFLEQYNERKQAEDLSPVERPENATNGTAVMNSTNSTAGADERLSLPEVEAAGRGAVAIEQPVVENTRAARDEAPAGQAARTEQAATAERPGFLARIWRAIAGIFS